MFCSVLSTPRISLWHFFRSPQVSRCVPVAWNAHRSGRPVYNGCGPSSSPTLLCGASHPAWSGLGQPRSYPSGCISFTSADNETAKCFGTISILTSDLEITIEPVARSNRTAFAQRVAGRSP